MYRQESAKLNAEIKYFNFIFHIPLKNVMHLKAAP